ncbi:MAG TPA: DUF692 domain-containing protein [Polyangiaceae bacterium]|jgi:hypothetical protein|nr:DUF692 domain-containing protein [Polyangiaceae bacterium]
MKPGDVPDLGVGVGLRVPHYQRLFAERPPLDFVEIISENFMGVGGRPRFHLERALEAYRVVQHGVSLGIGGPEAPSREYLEKLRELVRLTKTPWVSDHFCWCGAGGAHLHDLLPLPFTRELVRTVAERARMIEDFIEVPFALENTSSYLTYKGSVLAEWEFIGEIAERANIGLLFDVNNVFVTAYNHGLDPVEFVRAVPHARILQIHLAGHTNLGTHIIDTHDGHVIEPVWDLYRLTVEHAGAVSTLIEWDDAIPELEVLLAEADRAKAERQRALEARRAGTSTLDAATLERVRVAARAPEKTEARDGHGWNQGGPRESAGAASNAVE